jgi:hypothetical protein
MRRHHDLAAETVLLAVSRSPAGPSAHRRMRQGGQRCTKRCCRTRPWCPPRAGWKVFSTASRPQNWSVKSSCGLTRKVPGTAAPPDERGLRRRSALGYGGGGNPRAAQALGAGGRQAEYPDAYGQHNTIGGMQQSAAPTSAPISPGNPDLVTGRDPRCIAGEDRSGCAARWPLGRTRMRCQRPVRDGDG